MANMMKVCPYCRKWTTGTNICPQCGKELINTTLSDIFWNKATDEQKEKYTIQYCGENLTEEEKAERQRIAEEKQYNYEHMVLTTCPSVEGYHITQQFGLVFGEVVFKTGFFKALGASIDNFGDMISMGDQELSGTSRIYDNARQYAINKMTTDAWKKGANAIIGIDSESSGGLDFVHITIMGTAVYIRKDEQI